MGIGKKLSNAVAIAAVAGVAFLGGTAISIAAGDTEHPEGQDWQFAGPFGRLKVSLRVDPDLQRPIQCLDSKLIKFLVSQALCVSL